MFSPPRRLALACACGLLLLGVTGCANAGGDKADDPGVAVTLGPGGATTGTAAPGAPPPPPPATGEAPIVFDDPSDEAAACELASIMASYDVNDPAVREELTNLLDRALALDEPSLNKHLRVFYDATVGQGFDRAAFDERVATDPQMAIALVELERFLRTRCPQFADLGE